MIYAILLNNEKVVVDLMTYDDASQLPDRWIEITKNEFISLQDTGGDWSKYNNGAIETDEALKKSNLDTLTKVKLRFELLSLSNEIDLAEKMQEDTAALLTEFNEKKTQYKSLIDGTGTA